MSSSLQQETPDGFMTFRWSATRPTHTSSWTLRSPMFCLSTRDKFYISVNGQNPSSYNYLYTINLSLNFSEEFSSLDPLDMVIRIDSCKSFSPLTATGDGKTFNSESMTIFHTSMPSTMEISGKIFHKSLNYGIQGTTQKLLQDLTQLFIDETLSDLTVKSINHNFRVHRCILSSRSPVLSRMLNTDMKEKNEKEITLPCEDPIVIRELLRYMYIGDCTIAKAPHELFKIAHFLQISELCDLCTNFLLQNITIKNIIETLELSDEDHYELHELKKAANKFVEENERALVQDIEFENYLKMSIRASNVALILRIANDYNLTEVYVEVMKLLKEKSAEVLQNTDFRKLLLSNSKISIDLLEYVLTKMQNSLSIDSDEKQK